MLGKYENNFIKLANKLDKGVENKMKKLTLDIHSQVTQDTPKKTGWAANNWIPAIGKPFTKTVGSPKNTNPNNTFIVSGIAEVLTYTLKKGFIYISNNVPYISRLNQGSSKQAPAMFVEKAVKRAELRSQGRKVLD